MRRIGITGGIGSGKSALCAMFRARGYAVIDADRLAREAFTREEVKVAVTQLLGPGALREGQLDRKAVAALVWQDRDRLRALEAITHPVIVQLFEEAVRPLASTTAWVFYEAALLVETGRAREFDALVVVSAPEAVRRERVALGRGMPQDRFESIARTQMEPRERELWADFVVGNAGSLEDLEQEAAHLLGRLRERFALSPG